jgi:hypothetical protein
MRERKPEHPAPDDPDPRARHPFPWAPSSARRREAASARRRTRLALVALAVALVLPAPARATSRARLRWLPSASAVEAAGYLVYVRRADTAAPVSSGDAGLPPAGPSGIYEYVLDGLDPGVAYAVSIAGYSADGLEGVRSNEVVLAARTGPCAGLPEDTACDAGDPCGRDRCAGGSCGLHAGTSRPGTVLAAGLVLRRRLLHGSGTFVTPGPVDPRAGGVSVRLMDARGTLLYRADVPGGAFRVANRGRTFHALRATPHGGVRRLVLRHRGDELRVRLVARSAGGLAGAAEPLTWVLRIGAQCVRQTDLRCDAGKRRRRCF